MATRNYLATFNALANDGRVRAQCQMYILIGAVPAIIAEDPATANHAARLAWALAMEQSPTSLANAVSRLLIAVIQNATIAAALAAGNPAEDSDVEFVGTGYLATLVSLGA